MDKPVFNKLTVWLSIDSYEAAVEHYIDWLGFQIDWEWRQAPGQPVIMAISRGDVTIGLSEGPTRTWGTQMSISISNFAALVEEWKARLPQKYIGLSESIDPDSVVITNAIGDSVVRIQPENIRIRDPFGNILFTDREQSPAEKEELDADTLKMREYVQQQLDTGHAFPTPEEIRVAIRPDLVRDYPYRGPDMFEIRAVEVLGEFPGYADVFEELRIKSLEALQLAVVDLASQAVLVMERTSARGDVRANLEDMGARIRAYLLNHDAAPSIRMPFLRYLDAAEDFTIQVGFPVDKPIEGDGDIVRRELPGGTVVTALVGGIPTMGDRSDWSTIIEYAVDHGYKFDAAWGGVGGWEQHDRDPSVAETDATHTRVYLPIRAES
jgi:effector-binding domain-containing protein